MVARGCDRYLFAEYQKLESITMSCGVIWEMKYAMKMKTNWIGSTRIGLLLVLFGILAFSVSAQGESSVATISEVEELTEEVYDAEMAAIELDREKTNAMLGRYMPFIGMGFTIVILTVVFRFVGKADSRRHESIRKYLELGKEVPRELLVDSGNPQTWKPVSDMRKGVIWTSIGLGLVLMPTVLSGEIKAAVIGVIPLLVGIGYFVMSKLDPKPTDEQDS